ncbi:CdaR family transcriptional regulator [Ectobacillus ponti]|uniref:Helix-turn-helix domain-containing protein n=1 Tax=Ectobacillus ponti TaxID=2961894 RepID=A0AA41XBJ9_9BACI|nr:sugar diacid recognition domain-containing protein [Ectobacillus ponti]MCP8969945.1 helix-turn-helix domain-containing protein [Ectobacillus ponti]
MYELKPQQAQSIVDRMMKDIPYNINIMDPNGIIIGSGNPKRIGTLHHGAAAAIQQGKAVEIEQDEEFVKKGINLPITMNGTIVGVVGISGAVEETRPFGNLVKSAVILLIEQGAALEKKRLESSLKQEFFSLISDPSVSYTKELGERAAAYGIRLLQPSQIVYAEFPDEVEERLIQTFPAFKTSPHSLCIIVQEAERLEHLQAQLQRSPGVLLAVSLMNDKIADGLRQAKSAMRVLQGLSLDERSISYGDCRFLADTANLQGPAAANLSGLLEKHDDLIQTLQTYLKCNLNANETASRLIIHRNTLHYRLDRIHKITGRDPKHVLELVELIFMLISRVP